MRRVLVAVGKALLAVITLAASLPGQEMVKVEPRQTITGWYYSDARELPNGGCSDWECFWSVERLLIYYGVALDSANLKRALGNPAPGIRSMAADQLVKTGGKDALPSLAAALVSERAVGTRLHLAFALAQLGDERGANVLKQLCESGGQSDPLNEAEVRLYAAEHLWEVRKTTGYDCTIDLLHSIDHLEAPPGFSPKPAALGLAAMFESVTPEQAAAIRSVAERWILDEDESVRRMASGALARYGDATSYHILKAALGAEQQDAARACMLTELRKLGRRLEGLPPDERGGR